MHYNISYGRKWIGEKTIDPVRYTITSISIPETVKYIADNAFHDCYNLRKIIIPESVLTICTMAFYNCKRLQSVKILGNSPLSIQEYAFLNCKSLNKINIPKNIRGIHSGAFYGCDNLKSIILPINTGNDEYLMCDALNGSGIETIDLPNSCYRPYNPLYFADCHNLKSIIVHQKDYHINTGSTECEIIVKEKKHGKKKNG